MGTDALHGTHYGLRGIFLICGCLLWMGGYWAAEGICAKKFKMIADLYMRVYVDRKPNHQHSPASACVCEHEFLSCEASSLQKSDRQSLMHNKDPKTL